MARTNRRARPVVRGRRRTTRALLPMAVRPGDRFTDEEGRWEVVTKPTVFRHGKACEATVRAAGGSGAEKSVTWPAHEKITVTRAR